jgi:hypothetical protein
MKKVSLVALVAVFAFSIVAASIVLGGTFA